MAKRIVDMQQVRAALVSRGLMSGNDTIIGAVIKGPFRDEGRVLIESRIPPSQSERDAAIAIENPPKRVR